MLIESIIFSDDLTAGNGNSAQPASENSGFVQGYTILPHDENLVQFWKRGFYNSRSDQFCIALRSVVFENSFYAGPDKLAGQIGPLLFSANYFTPGGSPLIFILISQDVNGKNRISDEELLDNLKQVFEFLGFDKFYYYFIHESRGQILSTNNNAEILVYHQSQVQEDIASWYYNKLNTVPTAIDLIIAFSSLPANEIYEKLNAGEHQFKEDHFIMWQMLEKKVGLLDKLKAAEILKEGLKREIQSQEDYLSNLHIHETTQKKIGDFYHYEYEILPAWYKRLGHIIKVIMGKRSFRSLFDDNVKKYKD
ncbi:MAG TPA: hypothetical protein VK588_02140 [Chitinophagaceae bacterium]|nr:hypothetical protein [Chitinophagaceae bacterium]